MTPWYQVVVTPSRSDCPERAAALAAKRAGLSWGVIGAQLGMTRQGARQRLERLIDH